jgi:hypothetical protein
MAQQNMSVHRVMESEYMHWAKTSSRAKYNLALSDLRQFPLADLNVRYSDLGLTGPGGYGFPPLVDAIARKEKVAADCVVTTLGTSMANYIAMATLIEPGDEVVIEHPTYELLVSTLGYLGANVKRFRRRFEQKFLVDVDELRSAVGAKTKLIVLTNLHNPSSAFTDEPTLTRVGELASSVGAKVLVDEVYLDAFFSKQPRSAFHLGSQFVTTNSLTKVYGVSGLRCGWILAEPSLAQRMWRLIDLHYGAHAFIAEQLSVAVFSQLDKLSHRAQSLLRTNAEALRMFFEKRPDISAIPHDHGLVSFPRVHAENVGGLCDVLRVKYETSIVNGKFFDMPRHVRIGLGSESTIFRQGLANLALALDEIQERAGTDR